MWLIKHLNILFIGLLFIGCSSHTEYVDRYITVQCQAEVPDIPELSGTASTDVRSLIIYTNKLECLLQYCINGKFSEECTDGSN